MRTIILQIPDQLYSRIAESYRIQGITDTESAISVSINDFLYQSVDTDDDCELAEWTILNTKQGAMLLQTKLKECQS